MGAIAAGGLSGAAAAAADEFTRLTNVGKAHLENRNSAGAIEAFTAAAAIEPQAALTWRNLARGQLLKGDAAAARQALDRAREIQPESVATSFLTGLAHARDGRYDQAAPHFETAVRLDPHTATLRYQLAVAYQALGKQAEAKQQLLETVRLDPLHASACYRLQTLARQENDDEAFTRWNREFLRLRKILPDELRTPELLERCVYSNAEAPDPRPDVRPSIDVRFTDATAAFADDTPVDMAAIGVLELGDDGRYTLVVAQVDGELSLLKTDADKPWRRMPVEGRLPENASVESCGCANFHDDVPTGARYDPKLHALNDCLFVAPDRVYLLKRIAPTEFRDVTGPSGLAEARGGRTRWADYDHDGDVDLFLAGKAALDLWQNNGDGRFERANEPAGLAAISSATDVAAIDFDGNHAVDLVVTGGAEPTRIFENQRTGRFAGRPDPPGPWPAAQRVLCNDLDNDGYPDAVLIDDRRATVVFERRASRRQIELGDIEPAESLLVDVDNDGWLELCVAGRSRGDADRGRIRVWHSGPGAPESDWIDVSDRLGLNRVELPPVRALLAIDVDNDRDTDLVLLGWDRRLRVLRNDGGHANGQLKLRLIGTKTNPAGIGTHIELREPGLLVSRAVDGVATEFGLAGRTRLDSLQTLWTNGVVDNQINVEPIPPVMTIVERNVAAGSCPFLWAWDGQRQRFVTDILGNSPLGLLLKRGVPLPADADEIVWIGSAADFPPRDGEYVVEVSECFREVLYLDQARLIAVDHAADVEVHPTDKLMPPPFPPSELWALGKPQPLVRAAGEDDLDRTELLRQMDGEFAPPGVPLPPPLRGMCAPLGLRLDFGPLDVGRPLVLALTGWLQYGDASTNIALSQNAAVTIIPPKLEAEVASDEWTPLQVIVGMPAGKTKTILCDLAGKLPAGTRRLRLTTTFEIRWDRIALFERLADNALQQSSLEPTAAHLEWRGFPELKAPSEHWPTVPTGAALSDEPLWRTTPEGWCTRYGDVLELVTTRDDRYVILNAGDAVTLRFNAARLPELRRGAVRSFFFYSVGWDKDGDHNVVDGDQVEPLPVTAPAAADDESDWRLRYNTRWVPGDRFWPIREDFGGR